MLNFLIPKLHYSCLAHDLEINLLKNSWSHWTDWYWNTRWRYWVEFFKWVSETEKKKQENEKFTVQLRQQVKKWKKVNNSVA